MGKGPGQVIHGDGTTTDSNGNSWRDSSGVGADIDKCMSDSDEERYILDDELDEEMGEPSAPGDVTTGSSGNSSSGNR